MGDGTTVVLLIFAVSVIIGVVSGVIIYNLYLGFYGGNPGLSDVDFTASFLATGVAAAAFTIMLLFYPVVKKGVKIGSEGDDYR